MLLIRRCEISLEIYQKRKDSTDLKKKQYNISSSNIKKIPSGINNLSKNMQKSSKCHRPKSISGIGIFQTKLKDESKSYNKIDIK